MPSLSDAYWRPVWGELMKGYESVRDKLREDKGRAVPLSTRRSLSNTHSPCGRKSTEEASMRV